MPQRYPTLQNRCLAVLTPQFLRFLQVGAIDTAFVYSQFALKTWLVLLHPLTLFWLAAGHRSQVTGDAAILLVADLQDPPQLTLSGSSFSHTVPRTKAA